ncbi:sensor histidine kinase [Salinibaculum salinum]|uniref:sensor histidine kinase n=1 Tax=Salinibaculum salinum TaxID=3131996 RepID=UPI0030EDFAFE
MSLLFAGHVGAFALATLACFGSVPRARKIQHPGTRVGLVALLVTSGLWAGFQMSYLVAPVPSVQSGLYTLGLVAGLAAVGAWLYFTAAYTGRQPRPILSRWSVIGVFLFFVVLKATNPLHHLYFTTSQMTTPFSHLAIQYGVVHWVALGLAYSVSSVGFFMLLERFYYAGTDTRPLVFLVSLTALPVGFNVLGIVRPQLLSLTYEPLGVAVFAVGVLFVYFNQFQAVRLAGDADDPVVFLDRGETIRDYSRKASDLFPELGGSRGKPLGSVAPELATHMAADAGPLELERGGERRFYQVSTNPFITGETATGKSLVIADVTKTEQYRRDLEQKNEQLEALNRVVRHDIRNDMNIVLLWSEILEDHVDETGDDALGRVRNAAEHTVELTKIAREFVDSLAGDEALELKPIDLRTYLKNELEQAKNAYPDAECHAPSEIPAGSVQANELLSSVFRNLLNNAVQHNDKETPVITVSTAETGETVTVRVADNGPGIPADRRDEIFGKGEKGLDSEGTGIGLYLVEQLVQQFGGSVWVEHNEPTGAVFVVELQKILDEPDSQQTTAIENREQTDIGV